MKPAVFARNLREQLPIYQRVGNELLLKLLEIFWTVHKNVRARVSHETQDVPRFVQDHRALYEAIAQGDRGPGAPAPGPALPRCARLDCSPKGCPIIITEV